MGEEGLKFKVRLGNVPSRCGGAPLIPALREAEAGAALSLRWPGPQSTSVAGLRPSAGPQYQRRKGRETGEIE